jgi:hypothetical protein
MAFASDPSSETIFKCAVETGVKQPLYYLPRSLHVGPTGLHTRLLNNPAFAMLHPTNVRSMESIINTMGAKQWLDKLGEAYQWLERTWPADYRGIYGTYQRAVKAIGGAAGLKYQ